MWKRIKRVVQSNLGRFQDDPMSSSSASSKRDLAALSESLEVVRTQVDMLERDLSKLEEEETELSGHIRKALDANDRDAAMEKAGALARVRDSKEKIRRQLEAAREVCRKAEGVQHEVDSASSELAMAADATLAELEQDLIRKGVIEDTPRKSLVDDSGPVPQGKTIGGEASDGENDGAEKTIGGPSGWSGESTERTVIPKTIGGRGASPTTPSEEPSLKTLGDRTSSAEAPSEGKAPAEKGGGDLIDELERLGKLLEKGILTPAEFAQAKKKLLG